MEPSCSNCGLNGRPRTKPSGNTNRPLLAFVGEAPGEVEALKGVPFVGAAGKVLRSLIEYLGISVDDCYITNVCLCHPPGNAKPTTAELKCCLPRLIAELEAVQPKYIIALGATAGRAVVPGFTGVEKGRGYITPSIIPGIPVMLTYHPAALLYHKGDLKFPHVLNDFVKVWRQVQGQTLPYSMYPTQVFVADTADKIKMVTDRIAGAPAISFDWETTGVNPREAVGFCLGLSWKIGTAAVIPWNETARRLVPLLGDAFRHPAKVIGYNGMFDSRFNARVGLPDHFTDDALIMHALLDERPQRRSLENLSVLYCDAPRYESEMLKKYDCTKADFLQKVPVSDIYQYCGQDADYTLRLYEIFLPELQRLTQLYEFYKTWLMPAVHAFSEIKQNGVFIDRERLETLATETEVKLDELLITLREKVEDPEFNPASNPQTAKILFGDLELEEPELYGRKPGSVDKQTREALHLVYPDEEIIDNLCAYRDLFSTKTKYLKPIPRFIQSDGRLRAEYHFDRTETGRLSTTKPPIHQMPRESNLRSMVIAAPGHTLLQADYAGIEMRIAAHLARDKHLTELLTRTDVDFHVLMASEGFGIPIADVTKEIRQQAKPLSFGLLYGMGEQLLAKKTKLPLEEARKKIRGYKNLMPDVERWTFAQKKRVRADQFVESPTGRRRRFPFITRWNLGELERDAVNMPVQSGASDLTLTSVVRIHRMLKSWYPEARIVIMVHDSIVVECPIPLAAEVGALMKTIMEHPPFKSAVPFPVEIKIGPRWGEGEVLA